MAYASAHSHHISGFFGQIVDAISALRVAMQRSRVYVQTYNELSALTSRELADLGLGRSSISQMAYDAAYGRDD